MENEPFTTVAPTSAATHEELRARLRSRYQLKGEYVSAPMVALILGIGRTTVHDQVKTNRFVIPHRLVNRRPIFLLDDLVAWIAGREWPARAQEVDPLPKPPAQGRASGIAFKHASAEAAFLRVCEKRGIAVGRPRRA